MELDSFLDIDCEGCCGGTTVCLGAIAFAFINSLSSTCARVMLIISKFGGVILDCVAVGSVGNNVALMVYLIIYLIIDRTGALILMCIYGFRPTESFKRYAYYMEAAGKVKKAAALESLYFGSIFSLPDFMGKIWKSYTFVIEIDPTKVKKYEDRDTVGSNDANIQTTTPQVVQQVQVVQPQQPVQVIQQQPVQIIQQQPVQVVHQQQVQMVQQQQQQPVQIAQNHGWSAKVDANGRVYYQNNITKQTQWDNPEGFSQNVPTMPSYQAPKPVPMQVMQPQIQVIQVQQAGQAGQAGYPGSKPQVTLEKVTSNHSGKVTCFAIFYTLTTFILLFFMYAVVVMSFYEGASGGGWTAAILFVTMSANVIGLAQHMVFIGWGVVKKCKVKKCNCCCIGCAKICCFLMGIIGVTSVIFTLITMSVYLGQG